MKFENKNKILQMSSIKKLREKNSNKLLNNYSIVTLQNNLICSYSIKLLIGLRNMMGETTMLFSFREKKLTFIMTTQLL